MLTFGNTQLQHRKVSTSLKTACVLGNFCQPNVLCGQAFVCSVDDAADCTVVSPLTEVEAVRAVHGLNYDREQSSLEAPHCSAYSMRLLLNYFGVLFLVASISRFVFVSTTTLN